MDRRHAWSRVVARLLVAALAAALGLVACGPAGSAGSPVPSGTPSGTPRPSLSPAQAAAAVRVSATVTDRSLTATSAVADFGIDQGVRMVRVRIVDDLAMEIRVESATTITLAGPPQACLVGPYSAPDDAGLTDRCWGEPDLGTLLAAQVPTDADGHPMLRAGQPVVLDAALQRGHKRCDYPPGTWKLEVALGPIGVATAADADPIDLPPVTFDISPTNDAPLTLLGLLDTRYCGLAETVVRDQGEPSVIPSN